MKAIKFFLFIFLVPVLAKSQINFDKRFTLGIISAARKVVEVPGGYISAGYQVTDTTVFDNNLIVKTDFNGDTIKTLYIPPPDSSYWNLYGEDPDDIYTDLIITNDSNLIAAGRTQAYNPTNYYHYDILLAKLNYNLDTLWTKYFTHSSPDTSFIPQSIIQTNDSGFLICGKQRYGGFQDWYGFLYKVDMNGNFQWYKSYSNPGPYQAIWDVIETPQHNFICSGTQVINAQNDDMDNMLFITDSAGNQLWDTTVVTAGEDYAGDLNYSNDGKVLWLGTLRLGSTTFDPLINTIRKVDFNGNVIWNKGYQYYNNGGSVNITNAINTGYIYCGVTDNTTNILSAFIHRLDENGDSLWYREFTFSNYSDFWDIKTTADGGYIMCGQTVGCNNNGGTCFWLIKTDSLGLLTGFNSDITPKGNVLLQCFPNPCTSSFIATITTTTIPQQKITGKKGAYLLLFDATGRQLKEIPVAPNENTKLVDVHSLASGTHLCVLVVDGYHVEGKKIIIKK